MDIELSVGDEVVRMRSCSTCDTRWWERNGERIALDGVLQLATVPKR